MSFYYARDSEGDMVIDQLKYMNHPDVNSEKDTKEDPPERAT